MLGVKVNIAGFSCGFQKLLQELSGIFTLLQADFKQAVQVK
jgi:hypothetical protein